MSSGNKCSKESKQAKKVKRRHSFLPERLIKDKNKITSPVYIKVIESVLGISIKDNFHSKFMLHSF